MLTDALSKLVKSIQSLPRDEECALTISFKIGKRGKLNTSTVLCARNAASEVERLVLSAAAAISEYENGH